MPALHDPSLGMGALTSSRSALLKGDPGPGLAFIGQLPEVDREAALMGLCSGLPMQRAIDRLIGASPRDPDIQLLAAAARAENIWWWWREWPPRQDNRPDEYAMLSRSVEMLQRSLKSKDRPLAHTMLAYCTGLMARTGAIPMGDATSIIRQAHERWPDSVLCVRIMVRIQDLSDTPNACVDMAQTMTASARPNHPAHAEIGTAHIEQYFAGLEAGTDMSNYWANEVVLYHLKRAADALVTGSGPAWIEAQNILAFTIGRTSDRRRAQDCLAVLDGRYASWPWGLLNNPSDAFDELAGWHKRAWRR